jgi:Holliday junction DNA helicase RuvB
LRERFGIPLRLEFYKPEELAGIVMRGANIIGMNITDEGAFEIARRSRGTPRIAGRLTRRVRDFALVQKTKTVDAAAADAALMQLEVDTMGLDSMDRRYMTCIAENYAGGPAGVETIAAALSEQRDVLEDVVEPYLIQTGFIIGCGL